MTDGDSSPIPCRINVLTDTILLISKVLGRRAGGGEVVTDGHNETCAGDMRFAGRFFGIDEIIAYLCI